MEIDESRSRGRPRGRPRKYDHEAALMQAMQVFWRKGMTATSFDDLVEAMQMNRPSIYRAFGNKEEIYRQSLALFGQGALSQLDDLLSSDGKLRDDLDRFFDDALDVYCGGDEPLGCFIACIAVADITVHPENRPDLLDMIAEIDRRFEQRCIIARQRGSVGHGVDPALLARSLQGLLHTLAVRARAGQSRAELAELKAFHLNLLCGQAS